MADHMADTEPHWYVAHTYSGYEKKVKKDIEKTIKNRNLQDQILEVSIPMLNTAEGEEDDDKKAGQKKMFPAYVLINMYLNDDTWYVVRNTRGVTGFVGPGSKPVPLTEAEMASMKLMADAPACEFSIGDFVVIKTGVWEDATGVVRQINHEDCKLTINIDVFGRETPVEFSFNDVEIV
jgi:transcriptional antiterminator NusG